jgi:acetyl esterase/lipase
MTRTRTSIARPPKTKDKTLEGKKMDVKPAKNPITPANNYRVQETEAMVKALQACGGHVTLTVYPGVDHDSWTQTYANPHLYTWLLQHRRITAPNEKS